MSRSPMAPLLATIFAAGLQTSSSIWARSAAEVWAFRSAHPCPTTGRAHGACPGHQVDHIQPLCAGGLDKPENMQWITVEDHRWKTFVDVRECRKLKRFSVDTAGTR